MENVNQRNQELIVEKNFPPGDPVGNKFKNLIEGGALGDIDREVAESFIMAANNPGGLLSFLQTRNVDFNNEGIYKLKYSLLKDIYNLMVSVDAKYLNFNFVEIDPEHESLNLDSYAESNSMIYMVATLKNDEDNHLKNQNYLLLNARDSHSLSDQNIADIEKYPLENRFLKNGYRIFKEYFMYSNNENTQSIEYHIEDIRETLEKEEGKCIVFNVYLCQVSNIAEVIENLLPTADLSDKYERHFANREKQTTLVFYSGTDYYDMGSLRP